MLAFFKTLFRIGSIVEEIRVFITAHDAEIKALEDEAVKLRDEREALRSTPK